MKKIFIKFTTYIKGLGVPEQNLHKKESTLLCQDKTLEPYIVSVTGIWGGRKSLVMNLNKELLTTSIVNLKRLTKEKDF